MIIRCGFQESDDQVNDKIIEISKALNTNDIARIQNFIETVGTMSLIQKLDYHHMNESSSMDAIAYLLKKSGYFNLFPYFKKRESMSSTDIGHLVAMPHPFLKGSETAAKVIVGINKTAIISLRMLDKQLIELVYQWPFMWTMVQRWEIAYAAFITGIRQS